MRYYILGHLEGQPIHQLDVTASTENEAIEALLEANPDLQRCDQHTSGFVFAGTPYWIDLLKPVYRLD